MKCFIFYNEHTGKMEDLDDELIAEVTPEVVQKYLEHKWVAFIPQATTSGEGKTKEEAKENALISAYRNIAFYLESGQFKYKAEDFTTLSIEEIDEELSYEEIASLSKEWFKEVEKQAAE